MLNNTYTTKQGQAWDQVAKETLGSELYMHRLIMANPAHRYTVFFSAGTVLDIPEIETDKTPETMPPWKK